MGQTQEQCDAICWKMRNFFGEFLDEFEVELDLTNDGKIFANDFDDCLKMAEFCQNDQRVSDCRELEPLRPFIDDKLFSIMFLYDFKRLSKKQLFFNKKLKNREWITSAFIPPFVKTMIGLPFMGCHELTSIDIPDSVVDIGNHPFEKCVKLKNVRLPNNLFKIPYDAFCKCARLKTICLPDSIREIETGAFNRCHSLEEICLPSSLIKIDIGAFATCDRLKNVILPASLSYIGENAFFGCDNVEHYFYEGTKSEFDEIAIMSYCNNIIATIDCNKVYYYSSTNTNCGGRFWHYVNNKPAVW